MLQVKATSADYGLGPHAFPRGWFVIAEACELNQGPLALRFFGKDFALYRGESGRVVLLDAYCKHMGTHLTKNNSAAIVATDAQIKGDSIRCPYHAWQYGPDGQVEDIPYHDGPCPKSAAITSYLVKEVMGCIMMWHSPDGGEPDFDPPYVTAWNKPQAIHWQLDHLGELAIHTLEILDNMADVHHLGPTHGAPCEYFENEFGDHRVVQRQGGFLDLYQAHLDTVTWYTGPGILLSKQTVGGVEMFELIANTPIDDGTSKAWHGVLSFSQTVPATEDEIAIARQTQAAALQAFSADFEIWTHKKPAINVMQTKKDGQFRAMRKWVGQFYMSAEAAKQVQEDINGVLAVPDFPQPNTTLRDAGFEDDCYESLSSNGE